MKKLIFTFAIAFVTAFTGMAASNSGTGSDPAVSIKTSTQNPGKAQALQSLNKEATGESYPCLSADGQRLYFTSGTAIKMATWDSKTKTFTNPVDVKIASTFSITSAWLSQDELTIYFTTHNELYVAQRTNTYVGFDSPEKILLEGHKQSFISAPSLTPDQNQLFIYTNHSILSFSRTNYLSFAQTGKLNIPEGFDAEPGQLSRNGLRYALSLAPAGNKDEAQIYIYSRSDLAAEWSEATAINIEGLKNTYQPSLSPNGEALVFVSGKEHLWNNNDLYQIQLPEKLPNFSTRNLAPNISSENTWIKAFPNPSNVSININYRCQENNANQMLLYSATGNLVHIYPLLSSEGEFTIYKNELAPGIYYGRINRATGSAATVKIVFTD